MDAQELCNLQEAYMEVVIGEGKVPWDDSKNPLQSGHTPAEKNRAKRERTGVEDLSKSPTDKQYARYGDMKSVDDEQSSVSKKKDKSTHKFPDFPIRTRKGENQTIGQLRRSRGTPKPDATDEKSNMYQSPIKKGDKRTRGGRLDQWEGPNPRNEEYYLYDIILSHLLDEGYASNEEAADKIILNMSESWFEEIMESRRMDREGVDRKDPVRAARAERAKQSLDAVAKGEERKIKVSKKYGIEPSKADTVEKRAHKRDFPGSRQAPKEKGKKETPLETHNRRVNRQVDRVIKHGFTSKEKKEGEAMQKWHSPRN